MARMRKKLGAVLVSAAALSLTLTACGGGGGESESGGGGGGEVIDTSTASGDVNYWLWDTSPAARVPSLRRRVQDGQPQRQRQDHPVWHGTTTGPSSPTASSPAMLPTSSPTTWPSTRSSSASSSWSRWTRRWTKDGFNVDQYQPGLADLWKGQDGKRYGLPKDFDTIAIFYNKKLVSDAGVKEADLQNLHLEPHRTAERMRRPSRI